MSVTDAHWMPADGGPGRDDPACSACVHKIEQGIEPDMRKVEVDGTPGQPRQRRLRPGVLGRLRLRPRPVHRFSARRGARPSRHLCRRLSRRRGLRRLRGAAALPITAPHLSLQRPRLTHNLSGPLRAYADHQPLTATVNAIRTLLLGARLSRMTARRSARCGAAVMMARGGEGGAGGRVLIFTPSPWRRHGICMPEVWGGSARESARDETRRCGNLMGTQAFAAIALAARSRASRRCCRAGSANACTCRPPAFFLIVVIYAVLRCRRRCCPTDTARMPGRRCRHGDRMRAGDQHAGLIEAPGTRGGGRLGGQGRAGERRWRRRCCW
jgi:hypothetical protein